MYEQNKRLSDECQVRHRRDGGQRYYAHMLPKLAVRRKRRKPSGDRWIKSSGKYQKEKG